MIKQEGSVWTPLGLKKKKVFTLDEASGPFQMPQTSREQAIHPIVVPLGSLEGEGHILAASLLRVLIGKLPQVALMCSHAKRSFQQPLTVLLLLLSGFSTARSPKKGLSFFKGRKTPVLIRRSH